MFNNLKSSIQQAFFESLEQAGCLKLETEGEGREEDSDSGSEASDQEWEEGSDQEDREGGDEGDEEEDEDNSDSEECPAQAPGPDSQRRLPPSGGGAPMLAPGEAGGFVEVNLDSFTSPAKTADSRGPALDAALHQGSSDNNPRAGE